MNRAQRMMGALTIVSAVTSVVGAGCIAQTADQTIDQVYDPCDPLLLDVGADASAAQRESVSAALTMWNELAGAQLHLATDEAPDAPVVPVRFDDAGANFHGLYDDERSIVFINNALTDDRERAVTIAHELGHVFGLFHVDVDDHASVMNDGNLTTKPNESDEAALVRLWGVCPTLSTMTAD